MISNRVDWDKIEGKWQDRWREANLFNVEPSHKEKKAFVTFPFAYMNGPLHVGHGFTATKVDAYARYLRMQGYNVLFPWAWHWTGETIAGASERVRKRDPSIIKEFQEIDHVPIDELEKFTDPAYIAKYYTDQNRETVKRIGFSIDWRREFHTTSLEPTFSRFIEWQYKKLREGNYVSKGSHPVVWCPHCESPTGDHDRLEGEGVSPEEYILIKFRLEDAYLVAATFRPETIFGVTNLWLNPNSDYVKARVDGENWIISRQAADKLREQNRNIEIIDDLKGNELIGKKCKEPFGKRSLIILPGWFVSPDNGSGVVYSVPAHAPFDWIALKDLQVDLSLAEKFNITKLQIEEIKPISIITVEGHGEFPAIEIVDQLGVKNQNDPKCEDATKIIYKKEFHTGVLKENCDQYYGMKVREVKDIIIDDLKKLKIADSMYDLPEPIICRCTTQCRVKTITGQWFLRYSDTAWKEKTKRLLSKAKVFPESARQWFIDVIEWYRDWPCARKTGLGTPLPWSPDWIVETLSDSTVYMAFYTINKTLRELKITANQLSDGLFDYVYLGNGNDYDLSKETGINRSHLKSMRDEFLYWYPVDLRVSAKELLPNHLTFFLFQHAAIFPEELWPKGIGVNGMLMMEGQKMSKSKGNIVTLRKAIEEYGADITRCTLLLGADDMDDPDWKMENLKNVKSKLESLMVLHTKISNYGRNVEKSHLEDWLISRMHDRIQKITDCMNNLKTRSAIENAIYEIHNDFRWVLRRTNELNRDTLIWLFECWIQLLAPFAPHLAEEFWERFGKQGFITSSPWPKAEEYRKSSKAELIEDMIQQTLEDINNIIKATKKKPKHIFLYTANEWKWEITKRVIEQTEDNVFDPSKFMKEIAKEEKLRPHMKKVMKHIQTVSKDVLQLSPNDKKRIKETDTIDELDALKDANQFFCNELRAEIHVYEENDTSRYDPQLRASLAKPLRPAIYIE
jgi:leucyl-tRNA synthetase